MNIIGMCIINVNIINMNIINVTTSMMSMSTMTTLGAAPRQSHSSAVVIRRH